MIERFSSDLIFQFFQFFNLSILRDETKKNKREITRRLN